MQKLIPAEHWETFAESNSCMKASEQKGNTPISVKTFEHGGFLHTSFATNYGSYGLVRKPIRERCQGDFHCKVIR